MKIRGQLGKIDTGVTVRIVMENESSGIDMNALMRSDALFEAFRINNVLCCAMKYDADTVEASVVDDDPEAWQTGQTVAQRHITKNLELQPMNYLRIVADKASWHACGRRRGACGRHCFAS